MKKLLIVLFLIWGTILNAQPDKNETYVYAAKYSCNIIYEMNDKSNEWDELHKWGAFTIYFYQYEKPNFEVMTYWEFIGDNIKSFIVEEGFEILNGDQDSICYNLTTILSKSPIYKYKGIIKIITCGDYSVLEMWNFKTGQILYFDEIVFEKEYYENLKFLNDIELSRMKK